MPTSACGNHPIAFRFFGSVLLKEAAVRAAGALTRDKEAPLDALRQRAAAEQAAHAAAATVSAEVDNGRGSRAGCRH